MTGFDVKHKSFTLASSLHSYGTRFFKKLNFIIRGPRTRLGLNSFRYKRFWSSVPETLKKDELKCGYIKFLLTCYKK